MRLPYVVTFHGGGNSSRLRNRVRAPQLQVLRPLLARAERLVAVARWEVDHYSRLLRLPRGRFTVIPNGADLPQPEAESPSAPDAGTLIVSSGRLERYKGHQRVIEAFPHVLRRRPDARLRVAGTGSYEPELRKLVARLGLGARVEIAPVQGGVGMASLLRQASLVVLLSEFETHPLAAIEAAALDRPLVVADTAGLRELAGEGVARAIALPSSPGETAAAILEELDRPHVSKGWKPPTWDECTTLLLDTYREILDRRRCGS